MGSQNHLIKSYNGSRRIIPILVAWVMTIGWGACVAGERAPSNCKSERVYNTLIVYGQDQAASGPPLEPLDPVDNTLTFRQEAADFFSQEWGVPFPDVSNPSDQFLPLGCSPSVDCDYLWRMVQVPEEINYQVFALDYQGSPPWRHRMPITNTRVVDKSAIVIALRDVMNEGGTETVYPTIFQNSIIAFGFYILTATDRRGIDFALERIDYSSQQPILSNPYGWTPIPCKLKSELFGEGLVRGGATGSAPVPEGLFNFINTMTFPVSLTQKDPNERAKCKNIRRSDQ